MRATVPYPVSLAIPHSTRSCYSSELIPIAPGIRVPIRRSRDGCRASKGEIMAQHIGQLLLLGPAVNTPIIQLLP